jgi:hypothetical protein
MVRKPVNIPGRLAGISRGGALIYTVGARWDEATEWREQLAVSAYDSVAAYLVDTLPLARDWPHPVHVVGENVFIGVPGVAAGADPASASVLESWSLSESGKLVRLGSVDLGQPAQALADFNGLLAAQLGASQLALVELADPTALEIVGSGGVAGCLWFNLDVADGAAGRGLWIPLGPYGVGTIRVE